MAEGKLEARAVVTHRPGAVRMDDYPLLVYTAQAPDDQRGEIEVRVARTKVPIREILDYDRAHPDLPGEGLQGLFGLMDEEMDEVCRWDEDPNAPGKVR